MTKSSLPDPIEGIGFTMIIIGLAVAAGLLWGAAAAVATALVLVGALLVLLDNLDGR